MDETWQAISLTENISSIWQLTAVRRVCALGQGWGLSEEHAQHLPALPGSNQYSPPMPRNARIPQFPQKNNTHTLKEDRGGKKNKENSNSLTKCGSYPKDNACLAIDFSISLDVYVKSHIDTIK